MMDPLNPQVGDIFTYWDGELVEVTRITPVGAFRQIEIEFEDGVPVVLLMNRWYEEVKEGIFS
jgi:hypothetical protein